MLRARLKISLMLSAIFHGFVFALLMYCPVGIKVGAVKGSALSVDLIPHNNISKTVETAHIKKLKHTNKMKSPLIKDKKPSANERKTLLTATTPQPAGFDLRNLKSTLSPAMQKFFFQLRRDIESNKQYPKKAKRFRQRGEVAVRFEISKDGTIENIMLEKPSPFETLNLSAQKTISSLKGNKYPLPKEVVTQRIQVILPVRYQL